MWFMQRLANEMRRLTEQICEVMSAAARQKGVNIPAASLHRAVDRYLTDMESVLSRDVVESFSPVDWAVLISHARQYDLQPRDVVMEILSSGMKNSARLALGMHRKKTAQATRESAQKRPRPTLKLVK